MHCWTRAAAIAIVPWLAFAALPAASAGEAAGENVVGGIGNALADVDAPRPMREPPGFSPAGSVETAAASETIIYVPPVDSGPKHRLTGVTRGAFDLNLRLEVITPESVGLAASAQPTLYWFSSMAIPYPVEVLVANEEHLEPLLELRLPEGIPAGINRMPLADTDFRLRAGVDYRWSVAIVVDPVNRSRDLVASGAIRYVPPAPELARRIENASPLERPVLHAENGVWYDSLDELAALIRANPNDPRFRKLRAALLDQVNLPEVAAYDRSFAERNPTQ